MSTILQSIAEYYSAISFRTSHASLPVLLAQPELYCSFAYTELVVCTYVLIFLSVSKPLVRIQKMIYRWKALQNPQHFHIETFLKF